MTTKLRARPLVQSQFSMKRRFFGMNGEKAAFSVKYLALLGYRKWPSNG
ncbi:MAG: hypothetical protein OTI34_14960 [Lewinella sp.]|jgi:hypothetical protein|nr:hypothetical protein [Lewinella sp.]